MGYSRDTHGVLTRSVQRLGYGVVNLEEEAKKDDENIEELENAQVRGYPVSTPRAPPDLR